MPTSSSNMNLRDRPNHLYDTLQQALPARSACEYDIKGGSTQQTCHALLLLCDREGSSCKQHGLQNLTNLQIVLSTLACEHQNFVVYQKCCYEGQQPPKRLTAMLSACLTGPLVIETCAAIPAIRMKISTPGNLSQLLHNFKTRLGFTGKINFCMFLFGRTQVRASAEANCHAATSRYANSGITGLSPPTSTKTERMANGEGNVLSLWTKPAWISSFSSS